MAATDQYITQAILDDTRYVQGGRRVVQTDTQMAASAQRHQSSLSASASAMTAVATVAAGLAAAYGAVVMAFGQMAAAGLHAFGEIEALEKGLASTAGSAKEAAMRMKELREIAKAPGLGFQEAVSAFTKLTGSGASAEFAQRLIAEGANANARVGGGKEEFSRILLALSQALTKRNFEGQDARQLADANIPIYDILRRRFGSGDTGELAEKGVTSAQVLNALVQEWSELERVSGGLKNSFENLQDTGTQALASFGEGLSHAANEYLPKLNAEIEAMTESGVFKMLGNDLANSVESLVGLFGGSGLGGASAMIVGGFTYARSVVQQFSEVMVAVAAQLNKWTFGAVPLLGGIGIAEIHDNASAEAMSAIKSAQNLMTAAERRGARAGSLSDIVNDATAPDLMGAADGGKNGVRLERIAQATEKLASIFDKSAIGGGDLLRKGISVFDATTASRGGGSRSANPDVELGRMIDARIRRMMPKNGG